MIKGTTYYKITLDEAKSAYEDENSIVFGALNLYGWEAINVYRYLIGSEIVDNVLYLCVTDGNEIESDGELLDPEEAMAAVGPDYLQSYIASATPEIIIKQLTPYDLSDDVDIDEVVLNLLEDGYSFYDIVKDAADAQLIEL